KRFLQVEKMDLVDLKNAIVNVKDFDNYFIQEIVVNVTEMFRDPHFFVSLRKNVFPYIETFPQIRVWSAGCATGEEAYSTAIMLKDSNLLQRSFIFATVVSQKALALDRKSSRLNS